MTDRELRNREARLRRAATKKGLFIRKRKWKVYYGSIYSDDSFDGYSVGIRQYGVIVWGLDEVGMNAPTLEEAEEIVANY